MYYWKRRILSEIAIIAVRFGSVNYDEKSLRWVSIPYFELPAGWNQTSTSLLIDMPAGYPEVPPDGFYIGRNLHPANGKRLEHYFQEESHNPRIRRGWAWYCIHPAGFSWSPSASISHGDNLLKYIELIRLALTEAVQ